MSCYHPILAIDYGDRNIETGGIHYTFRKIPKNFDPSWPWISEKRTSDGFYEFCSGLDPDRLQSERYPGHPLQDAPDGSFPYKLIPCGRCDGCRLAYSKQWANRCLMELESHDSAFFVTLTYNDQFVPKSYYTDGDGVCQMSLTLQKRDFQLFMKRLRQEFSHDRIRFFASGEYGDNTFRPHYHAILFGLHLDDLTPSGKSPEGFQYYYSPRFQRCWSQQVNLLGDRSKQAPYQEMGYALVAPVTWETCAYVARYTMKKLRGNQRFFYEEFSLEPPFSLMSLKPGIGADYLRNHPDIYDYSYINLMTEKGGKKVPHPRYLDKLFEVEHPTELAEIKATRERMAREAARLKMDKSSYNYLEMLAAEEEALKNRIKSLKRDSF